MVTIGLVANVYNEANALPGWLETHLPFFDDVRVLHAGPKGEYSNDGTIELLQKWNVPVEFCSIDEGFGVVRTKALRMSHCDYIMLLDADERFYPIHRVMTCEGESTPPGEVDEILQSYDFRGEKTPRWTEIDRLGANLRVGVNQVYNQGTYLRDMLERDRPDAVTIIRRHWHDMTFKRPTQNWNEQPDYQMRLVKNDPLIHFASETRMHERIVGVEYSIGAQGLYGPFFDHFHFTFKRMEPKQRAHDIAIYDAIHAGSAPPTDNEFRGDIF